MSESTTEILKAHAPEFTVLDQADKQRDIYLKEYAAFGDEGIKNAGKALEERLLAEANYKTRPLLDAYAQALVKVETQQAQIKGLVDALTDIDYTWSELHQKEVDGWNEPSKIANQALSTLPSEFLERERKRDALIEAAKKWFHEVGQQSCEELGRACSILEQSVESLEDSP